MAPPHFQIFINENSIIESAKEIVSALHPEWDLAASQFKFFTKGITNTLLGCFNANNSNDIILIRVYGNKSDLLIDRSLEIKNLKALHSAGIAPKLYATFKNGIVYEYVPGEILSPVLSQLENCLVLVARKLADMHCINIDNCKQPVFWERLRKFLSLVPPKFTDNKIIKRVDEVFPQKLDLEGEYMFLEKHLKGTSSPLVFCHNDLLLANIIHNSENNTVSFIDYEYAGYNYQAFDIANHFNEYAGVEDADYSLFPNDEYQKKWIKVYWERFKMNSSKNDEEVEVTAEEVESIFLDVQKFTPASHFLWGVWCFVQVQYSLINFDFVNYAFVRFQEYFKRKKKIFSC